MYGEEPWTAESIAKRLPEAIGVETMPMIAKLAAYAQATGERKATQIEHPGQTGQDGAAS